MEELATAITAHAGREYGLPLESRQTAAVATLRDTAHDTALARTNRGRYHRHCGPRRTAGGSEIACYEPGQSTVMHSHPKEEEAIYVLEGTANMSIDGQEVVVPAGSIVKFPNAVMHDVRNLGTERCVIMFLKVNPKVLKASHDG
ncbi:MAG: hypothetical protein DMD77_05395 [Candidatus Rokuibacteriota bacterium]|nr:MAG: hypothetical protein DMD77_05395 [Candidatus Rokubacteria bacterium]